MQKQKTVPIQILFMAVVVIDCHANGLRATKTVNGTKSTYVYVNGLLTYEKRGNIEIYFWYDSYGHLMALRCFGITGNLYYYVLTNIQGDVLGIYNGEGQLKVSYEYDTWGNLISMTDTSGVNIGTINPIRYRGYYYDTETGLYYLQSRYYDPQVGRFINADDTSLITATPTELTDKNLYSYCDNNPVVRVDDGGGFWHIVVGAAIGGLIGGISSIVGQAVSGQKINWAEVGISAASGVLTGAITAACPSMGAVATGIVHGIVGSGTHVATELVNGRTPTVSGTLAAGVTSGVLAGGTKAICNSISSGKLEIGRIKGVRASEGYPGIRFKTNAGPAYSVELHSSHKGHTLHIQVNKWLYHYKGYEGQAYRYRSWHYEIFKPWKGIH